ncbi:MAG: HU family DNA-binding protein [Pseudomonadota bacterium]
MARSELVTRLAQRFPQLVQKGAEMAVAEILGAMHAALIQGEQVEIRGFGNFSRSLRSGRQGRHPKTGEPVTVPAKWFPPSRPGSNCANW